jgi:hypothetical protein
VSGGLTHRAHHSPAGSICAPDVTADDDVRRLPARDLRLDRCPAGIGLVRDIISLGDARSTVNSRKPKLKDFQRDEFSLSASKFESDLPSHAVGSPQHEFPVWGKRRYLRGLGPVAKVSDAQTGVSWSQTGSF